MVIGMVALMVANHSPAKVLSLELQLDRHTLNEELTVRADVTLINPGVSVPGDAFERNAITLVDQLVGIVTFRVAVKATLFTPHTTRSTHRRVACGMKEHAIGTKPDRQGMLAHCPHSHISQSSWPEATRKCSLLIVPAPLSQVRANCEGDAVVGPVATDELRSERP